MNELQEWIDHISKKTDFHTEKIAHNTGVLLMVEEIIPQLSARIKILEAQVKALISQRDIDDPLSEKTVTKQDDGSVKNES